MNWVVFTTVATHTSNRFLISLDKVNWLSNIVCAAYVFTAPAVPFLLARLGLRTLCIVAAVFLVVGSWFVVSKFLTSSRSGNGVDVDQCKVITTLEQHQSITIQPTPSSFSARPVSERPNQSSTVFPRPSQSVGSVIERLSSCSRPSPIRLEQL